jgi:hypothetical protein
MPITRDLCRSSQRTQRGRYQPFSQPSDGEGQRYQAERSGEYHAAELRGEQEKAHDDGRLAAIPVTHLAERRLAEDRRQPVTRDCHAELGGCPAEVVKDVEQQLWREEGPGKEHHKVDEKQHSECGQWARERHAE